MVLSKHLVRPAHECPIADEILAHAPFAIGPEERKAIPQMDPQTDTQITKKSIPLSFSSVRVERFRKRNAYKRKG